MLTKSKHECLVTKLEKIRTTRTRKKLCYGPEWGFCGTQKRAWLSSSHFPDADWQGGRKCCCFIFPFPHFCLLLPAEIFFPLLIFHGWHTRHSQTKKRENFCSNMNQEMLLFGLRIHVFFVLLLLHVSLACLKFRIFFLGKKNYHDQEVWHCSGHLTVKTVKFNFPLPPPHPHPITLLQILL